MFAPYVEFNRDCLWCASAAHRKIRRILSNRRRFGNGPAPPAPLTRPCPSPAGPFLTPGHHQRFWSWLKGRPWPTASAQGPIPLYEARAIAGHIADGLDYARERGVIHRDLKPANIGYVVHHVVPLKRGGADKPENMQWQKTDAAKAKDRIE